MRRSSTAPSDGTSTGRKTMAPPQGMGSTSSRSTGCGLKNSSAQA
jgi:hypothetical protein